MTKKSSASLLPHDVVLEILSHLPARSIARLRDVSALWRASTSEPSFVSAQLRRAPRAIVLQVPRSVGAFDLFLLNGDTNSNPISISVDYATVPNARIRSYFLLVFSCDDLLCFRSYDFPPHGLHSHYVFSLATREWTPVANVNGDYRIIVAFYSHPSTKEYRFLRALDLGPELIGFEVSTLGSNTWRRIPDPSPIYQKFLRHMAYRDLVFLHGGFYWVSDFPDLEVCIMGFDTDTEEFRKIPLPSDQPWRWWVCQGSDNYLFDMDGRLGLCQVTAANKMVMWELSKNSGKWVQRSVISSASFNVSLNHRTHTSNLRLLKSVSIWKHDELFLHYEKAPYIYNFKLKTLRPVVNFPMVEHMRVDCFVIKESIAFCEAFKPDHSRPWHELYRVS